ncbi:hypothetical protein [Paracoccus sp. (in: a-proteobacteria)]|uniref:hypothetical protein n=1 Tax=Paracoccus sp. TaxID=267 RepID=UPI002AFF3CBA|nr:hypothetical protein [Paracoccus sp. (in: a-proteobacteria)]
MPRIGFIDETSLKMNMAKTTGWSPRGARLIDHAPFSHWTTQTFIAALRYDRLDAPWVNASSSVAIRQTTLASPSDFRISR